MCHDRYNHIKDELMDMSSKLVQLMVVYNSLLGLSVVDATKERGGKCEWWGCAYPNLQLLAAAIILQLGIIFYGARYKLIKCLIREEVRYQNAIKPHASACSRIGALG